MILPNTTMYLLKYDWYADRYWQGGITDFQIFELSNPCDYAEILSVTKKCFEERCADKLLDLDSIYIDRNSIEDIPARVQSRTNPTRRPARTNTCILRGLQIRTYKVRESR